MDIDRLKELAGTAHVNETVDDVAFQLEQMVVAWLEEYDPEDVVTALKSMAESIEADLEAGTYNHDLYNGE